MKKYPITFSQKNKSLECGLNSTIAAFSKRQIKPIAILMSPIRLENSSLQCAGLLIFEPKKLQQIFSTRIAEGI
jgi:hypothetical protein